MRLKTARAAFPVISVAEPGIAIEVRVPRIVTAGMISAGNRLRAANQRPRAEKVRCGCNRFQRSMTATPRPSMLRANQQQNRASSLNGPTGITLIEGIGTCRMLRGWLDPQAMNSATAKVLRRPVRESGCSLRHRHLNSSTSVLRMMPRPTGPRRQAVARSQSF